MKTILGSAATIQTHNTIVDAGQGGQYRVFCHVDGGYSHICYACRLRAIKRFDATLPWQGRYAYAIKVTPKKRVPT